MDEHIQTAPQGESKLIDEVSITRFYFSVEVFHLLLAFVVCFGFSAWMLEGIYSPETAVSRYKPGSLFSDPKVLFWSNLFYVSITVPLGLYILAKAEHKLVLDVKHCTLEISYLFLRDKTIHFDRIDSLLVFQNENEPSVFGLQCLDKDQRKDKYRSKGLYWRLAETQLAPFVHVIKKHRLDRAMSPWDWS